MAAFEILQHIGQLAGGGGGIQRQHAVDDMIGPGLVGGIEIARLGRRLEGPHDHPRRIGPQVKRMPVQESGCGQDTLFSLGSCLILADVRAARDGLKRASRGAMDLAHFRQADEIGDGGFPAAIFVDPVGMQAVAAAAGFQIDQRQRQIIVAQEPGEGARRLGHPARIAIGPRRRQAGGNGRGRFQRLLVEHARPPAPVAETVGADGPEDAGLGHLLGHQPGQGFQARLAVGGFAGGKAGDDQRLAQPGIVIGEAFLEPDPVMGFDRRPGSPPAGRPECAAAAGPRHCRHRWRNRHPGPAA